MLRCEKCGTNAVEGSAFCQACGYRLVGVEPDSAGMNDVYARLRALEAESRTLSARVDQHADVVNRQGVDIKGCEKILSSSALYSEKFWTRAWAIVGHSMATGLIIYGIVFAVSAIIASMQ